MSVYLLNAFSPSMLPRGRAVSVSFVPVPLNAADDLLLAGAYINALNPRHESTARALGVSAPASAPVISLAVGDLCLVVTPRQVDRSGAERELSRHELDFTVVCVCEMGAEVEGELSEVGGGDVGRPSFDYRGSKAPLELSPCALLRVCFGTAWDMGGWVCGPYDTRVLPVAAVRDHLAGAPWRGLMSPSK